MKDLAALTAPAVLHTVKFVPYMLVSVTPKTFLILSKTAVAGQFSYRGRCQDTSQRATDEVCASKIFTLKTHNQYTGCIRRAQTVRKLVQGPSLDKLDSDVIVGTCKSVLPLLLIQ